VSVVQSVPTGVKENVWFKVQRSHNAGDKFWDDCGTWTGHHGSKSYHLQDSLTEVRVMDDSLYGCRKRVDGKRAIVQLEPQPDSVVCVHRIYTKLSRHNSYQRRVTYVDGYPYFIVEYRGVFPGFVQAHGNASKSSVEYVRTHPTVIQYVTSAANATKDKPRQIYQKLQTAVDNEDDSFKPRNRKQVENVSSWVNRSGRTMTSSNLADEIQTILS